MNTNTKEQKIIQLFMAVLFLAIVLVYLLLFQVKGKSLKAVNNTSGSAIQISVMSGDQEQTLTAVDQERQALAADTGTQQTGTSIPTTKIDVLTETPKTATTTGGNIVILSGTNVFYGTIEAVEKLGIKYQYALVDNKNIYYVNLGNPVYDFASIARKLGGNLYELKTEQELAQNKLFGTKVTYINLPEYKEKRVLMLLYIKDQVRLIQMDYSLYHKTKAYLKSLFTQ
ncbi:MAG: hypothetical protein NTX91_05320 [candidate division SR1 bacterium]|nr:hypothetical protein [candidate division SR1 bacterium]